MNTLAFRRLFCRLLIGALLFTQLAVAAYACAGSAQFGPGGSAVTMSVQGGIRAMDLDRDPIVIESGSMALGHGLDPALPNLCAAHYQFGQQSSDHPPAPAVPAAALIGLYVVTSIDEAAASARPPARPTLPVAAIDPPHAILHCCLRT